MVVEVVPASCGCCGLYGVVGIDAVAFVVYLRAKADDIFTVEVWCKVGQGVGTEPVVAVYKEDIIALRHFQASVTGCGHTVVGLADNLNLRVLLQYGCGAVGATIINNDNLVVRIVLRENAVEASLQIGFGIICWYDDGKAH